MTDSIDDARFAFRRIPSSGTASRYLMYATRDIPRQTQHEIISEVIFWLRNGRVMIAPKGDHENAKKHGAAAKAQSPTK